MEQFGDGQVVAGGGGSHGHVGEKRLKRESLIPLKSGRPIICAIGGFDAISEMTIQALCEKRVPSPNFLTLATLSTEKR